MKKQTVLFVILLSILASSLVAMEEKRERREQGYVPHMRSLAEFSAGVLAQKLEKDLRAQIAKNPTDWKIVIPQLMYGTPWAQLSNERGFIKQRYVNSNKKDWGIIFQQLLSGRKWVQIEQSLPISNDLKELVRQEVARQYFFMTGKFIENDVVGFDNVFYGFSVRELHNSGHVRNRFRQKSTDRYNNRMLTLDLSNLHINSLEGIESINLKSHFFTEKINLSGNSFVSLSSIDLLKNFPSLRDVDLRDNDIRELLSGVFEMFGELKRLRLSGNKIESIVPGAFKGLEKLQMLSLDNNFIIELFPNAFVGLKSLTMLSLEGAAFHGYNPINKINPGSFRGLIKLKKLYLAGTKVKELLPDTFEGLESLVTLSIQESSLEKIAPGAFRGLKKLTKLSLDYNEIKFLVANTFRGLSSLEELNLMGNKVNMVERGAFRGLVNLKALSLDDNQIPQLPMGFFDDLAHVKNLKLDAHNKEQLKMQMLRGDKERDFDDTSDAEEDEEN